MASLIAENQDTLSQRHYIRNARTRTYWFDFTAGQVESYRRRYGNDFCLVLNGSDEVDDAYILPYAEVSAFFDPALTDDRNRWIGTVRNDVIRLSPGGRSMSVSAYYNAYDRLEHDVPGTVVREPETAFFVGEQPALGDIRKRIHEFNRQYRDASPYRRRAVSEQIARPGAITDYLKQLHGYTCQLCGTSGFRQQSGALYAEAHHINELHLLLPGSYCSDNVVVVCPTCHRKLHYGVVSYSLDQDHVMVTINGDRFMFSRNLLSEGGC